MKHSVFKFAAITSLLLVTGLGGQLLFNRKPPREEETEAVLGNAHNLMIAYERWKAQAMQNGADRNLVLPLGYSKGLSAEFTKAHGQAILDLVDGVFSFEVSGLSDKDAFDVCLIDNRPGPRHSVKPEPGDGLVKLGRLDHGQGMGRLEARLDRQALRGFKLDQVVVARADKHPGEGGLLFGSPDLFQRLFYNEKGGLVAQLNDALHRPEDQDPVSAPLRFLVPSAVQANEPVDPAALAALIIEGEDLFFKETFAGNGRTCGTCHPKNNNFTIDPAFIAKLPADDPLFVAEFNSDLACNDGNPPSSQDSNGCPFENPKLMRQFGLILENVDGIDDSPDLENKFVMRGVPHTLALPTSLTPQSDFSKQENTGWSGDGAPGGGALRDFATGAVFQHFTKTLNRVNKIDFVLPTRAQLNALEAFQRSLGRSQDLDLTTLVLTSANATVGQIIFRDGKAGQARCASCHFNAGAANSDAENSNFNTGVEDITDDKLAGMPRDGGFGTTGTNGPCTIPAPSSDCGFGDGEFATSPVIEAADTGPFFHNNAVNTIEETVLFYNGREFNTQSRLDDGRGIQLEATEAEQMATFLRVINALENIRAIDASLNQALAATAPTGKTGWKKYLGSAKDEIADAIRVLEAKRLHPTAVASLKVSLSKMKSAMKTNTPAQKDQKDNLTTEAISNEHAARGDICEAGSDAVLCP